MKLRCSYSCLVTCALLSFGAGCGDDSLGGSFQPKPGDSDEPPEEELPIKPGDVFWGFFSASTTPSSGGAEVIGELQSSGHVCLKVTGIKQSGTSEALVTSTAKVVGSASSAEIIVQGVADDGTGAPIVGNADPATVDAAVAPLWLKKLTFASRNHGFSTPVSRDFHTRWAPTPNRNVTGLPFFDVRHIAIPPEDPELDDPTPVWGGWADEPNSWLREMFSYLMDTIGCTTFTSSDAKCHQSHPTILTCENYEGLACAQAGCTWDEAASTCSQPFRHQVVITWRETLTNGADYFQGETVLHTVRFTYNIIGVLSSAYELIVPDPDPSANVTSASEVTSCRNNLPCARSDVSFESNWSNAPCTF